MARTVVEIAGPELAEDLAVTYAAGLIERTPRGEAPLAWERAYELARIAVEAGCAYAVATVGQIWRNRVTRDAAVVTDVTEDGDGETTVHLRGFPGPDTGAVTPLPMGDFAAAWYLIAWPLTPVGGTAGRAAGAVRRLLASLACMVVDPSDAQAGAALREAIEAAHAATPDMTPEQLLAVLRDAQGGRA